MPDHQRRTRRTDASRHPSPPAVSRGTRLRLAASSVEHVATDGPVGTTPLVRRGLADGLAPLRDRAEITEYLRASTGGGWRDGVALLLLDLDDFHVVNDSLGHDVGDLLLTQVARRIGSQVAPEHRAARMVGDGFLVVLTGSDASEAIELAEGLLASLEAPLHIGGTELTISSSIGIATSDCVQDVDDLLGAAEVALYRAKQRGKAGIAVFRPHMLQVAKDRLSLETALRRAVRNEELHVAYQPIVDLKTGALSGVEALARWHDEARGDVSPAEFIAVAERSGLILPLGEWVLRTATSCLQRWNAQAPGSRLVLNVNVSPRQLERHGFLAVVDELVAAGLDPSQLVLEITETALARDDDAVTETLRALRGRGIKLAVDDFGTGYSSLSRLRSAPVSQLKIDRSFISEITHVGADVPIVDATAAMAVGLKLGVIAEGIENLEQLQYLRRLGCGHAQGHLLARPADADSISSMLAGELPWAGLLTDQPDAKHRTATSDPSSLSGGRTPRTDQPLQWPQELQPAAVVTAAETIAALAAAEVAADAAATARAAVTVACAAALKAATKAEAVAADAAAATAAAASMLRVVSGSRHPDNLGGAGPEADGGPSGDGSTAHAARHADASRKAAVSATADAAAAAAVKVAVQVETVAAAAATATLEAAALIELELIGTVADTATAVARAAPPRSDPDADRRCRQQVQQLQQVGSMPSGQQG